MQINPESTGSLSEQEIDARSDSGREEIQIFEKVLESMCVQRITSWGLEEDKSSPSATGYNRETQWDRVLIGYRWHLVTARTSLCNFVSFGYPLLNLFRQKCYEDSVTPGHERCKKGKNKSEATRFHWESHDWQIRLKWWNLELASRKSCYVKDQWETEDFWHAKILAHYLL
jgi:hypothetical protein